MSSGTVLKRMEGKPAAAHFLTAVARGWLYKQGTWNTEFKKRYFCLVPVDGDGRNGDFALLYYERPDAPSEFDLCTFDFL